MTTTLGEHKCQIENDRQNGALVVRVTGALDWATASQLSHYLRRYGHEPAVVVDLSAITQSDSAGVGVLLVAAAEASEQVRQLAVVVSDPVLSEVLYAVGLGIVVPIAPTLNEALDAMKLQASTEP